MVFVVSKGLFSVSWKLQYKQYFFFQQYFGELSYAAKYLHTDSHA